MGDRGKPRLLKGLRQMRIRWQTRQAAVVFGILSLLLVLTFSGCSGARVTPANSPAPVSELVDGLKLPTWIEQISPTGAAVSIAQIRVRFREPLIPAEQLDSAEPPAILSKFELSPPLPGHFRFLTPRMVEFQPEQTIPKATRLQVTLKAGLATLNNHRLGQDYSWTFNTEPIQLSLLPEADLNEVEQPLGLNPTLTLTSNVELDTPSLKAQLRLTPEGQQQRIPVMIRGEPPQQPAEDFSEPLAEAAGTSVQQWRYQIKPTRSLDKSTRYRLEVAPGLRAVEGNLGTETLFSRRFQTYAPLEFQQISYFGQPDAVGAYGRFTKGALQLQFNNGLEAASVRTQVSLTPKPREEIPLVQPEDGDRLVNLNPLALEPNTTYQVTIGANLKDRFGQTLGKSVTLTYETGDLAPDLWAPAGMRVLPIGEEPPLMISTVNLSEYKAAFVRINPGDLVYYDAATPDESGNGLLPNLSSWKTYSLGDRRNQPTKTPMPLDETLEGEPGLLAYGIQAQTNRYVEDGKEKWRKPTVYGMVQLTNLGVFAQWFADSGVVRVHRLSNGAPVPDAEIDIFQSQLDASFRPTPSPCAEGTTDRTGTLLLSREDLQKCMDSQTKQFAEPPKLLVVARVNQDWAFTRTYDYSGAYGYGINADWQSSRPLSRGTLFSDRPRYQPGETVHLTGVAYYTRDGVLQRDAGVPYTVKVESPNGQISDLGPQTPNEFGTFSLEWAIDRTQPLGNYRVWAENETGVQLTGTFQVTEFKPANFQVELTLRSPQSPQTALPLILSNSPTIVAEARSRYAVGAPAEGSRVQYEVTRRPIDFTPAGREDFAFGQRWLGQQNPPAVTRRVLSTSQVLDKNGAGQQEMKLDSSIPYPLLYQVTAQVTNVSNRTALDSETFLLLPSDRLIGLKTHSVAEQGQPFSVQVVVSNPQGQAIEGQRVRVELQQILPKALPSNKTGGFKTVAAAEILSGQQAQVVSLTPPTPGAYQVRAQFVDRPQAATVTEVPIWVAGSARVDWDSSDRNRLEIRLDQASYQLGEMATALIQSPYPNAELWFTVVRNRVLYRRLIRVSDGAPQIRFPITAEMFPNAAVQAVLVRQGRGEDAKLGDRTRIGFAPLTLNLNAQKLTVKITATPEVQPGAEQVLRLTLRDAEGTPVPGQVTIAVVNEAVLQGSNYHLPDLVNTVFAAQPIVTRLSSNHTQEGMVSPAMERNQGGSRSTDRNAAVVGNSRALAYYSGSLKTDSQGQASVRFRLPNELATWRVMVVATGTERRSDRLGQTEPLTQKSTPEALVPSPPATAFRFGADEVRFVTTKPLVTHPLMPRFARLGDQFEVGIAINDNSGQDGTPQVSARVEEPLKLNSPNSQGEIHQNTSVQATLKPKTIYRFPVVAEAAGSGKVRFSSQLNGMNETLEMPLEVRSLEMTEQMIASGIVEKDTHIALAVDRSTAKEAGGLQVALSSTVVPTIVASARQAFDETDLPFLEPAASQLTIAAALQTFTQTYGQTFASFSPAEQAVRALERIQKLQRPDGGFAAFPAQRDADPFVTPYAARSIARAVRAFKDQTGSSATNRITIPDSLLSPLKTYLKQLIAEPGQSEFCQQTLCQDQVRLEALIALSELGSRRSDFLSDLYDRRHDFDSVSQIKLARYLSQTPGWRSEGEQLAKEIRQKLPETTTRITVPLIASGGLPPFYRWQHSSTVAQAQALRLFIAQESRIETLNKLMMGLLDLRRGGTWQSTYENAEALMALVEYSRLQPEPPNFRATAQLANRPLLSARFEGYRNPSSEITVPIAQLPPEPADLVLRKIGRGNLHYLVAYRYRLEGDQPGRFNGLRISRTIRSANQETMLYRNGLNSQSPLTVPLGQVFDVGLELITDHAVDHVVITDPLPAGLEAVDGSFQTAAPDAKPFSFWGNRWQLGFQTIHRDRIVALGDRLEPGVYTLHYLVRSTVPGTFLYPGAEARLQYAPEQFGRSASTTLQVIERAETSSEG